MYVYVDMNIVEVGNVNGKRSACQSMDLVDKKGAKLLKKDSTSHVPKQKKKPSELSTQCRPNELVKLIKDLSSQQVQDVNDIGFGGLCSLHLTQSPTTMIPFLIKSFNPGSWVFRIDAVNKFVVSKFDVHEVFLLPMGDYEVEEISTGRGSKESDNILKREFRFKFDVVDDRQGISLKDVAAKIRSNEMQAGGDEFKSLFVLYAMGRFLAPTSNNKVDLKLLKAVSQVCKIKEFDWCSYVLEKLSNGFGKYHVDSLANLGGCVIMLEIIYFHRLVFKSHALPRDPPLVQFWTDEKFQKRIHDELGSGSFGNGILDLESHLSSRLRCNSVPSVQDIQRKCLADISHCKKVISFEIPDSLPSDEEIHKTATDVCPPITLIIYFYCFFMIFYYVFNHYS